MKSLGCLPLSLEFGTAAAAVVCVDIGGLGGLGGGGLEGGGCLPDTGNLPVCLVAVVDPLVWMKMVWRLLWQFGKKMARMGQVFQIWLPLMRWEGIQGLFRQRDLS